MVKRLKDEKVALEEQVELLSEQMMPPSANSSALGPTQCLVRSTSEWTSHLSESTEKMITGHKAQ